MLAELLPAELLPSELSPELLSVALHGDKSFHAASSTMLLPGIDFGLGFMMASAALPLALSTLASAAAFALPAALAAMILAVGCSRFLAALVAVGGG